MNEEIKQAIELLTRNGYSVTPKVDLELIRKQIEYKKTLNEKLNEVVDLFDLKNRNRFNKSVCIRHYFSYFVHENFKLTLQDIGKFLGKDHATIIYSIRKHHELSRYKDYKESIEGIKLIMIYLKNSLNGYRN
jgi:chromosomal replication initiation ATPase DnaA